MTDAPEAFPDLADAVASLLVREPFFGHVAAGLGKELVDGAMRLTSRTEADRVVLRAGREWLLRSSRPRVLGSIKHEILHWMLEHPTRRRAFGNHTRFDLAADLVVNELLSPVERALGDAMPEAFDLPAGLSVDEYYRLLPAGQASRIEPPDGGNESAASHDAWTAERSAHDAALCRETIAKLVESATTIARQAGVLPRNLERLLLRLRAGATLDWRRVLRRFVASSTATYLRSTIQRPSRRYGVVPGTKVLRRSHLACVLDTSGSVTGDDLARFGAELQAIARAGATIDIVYCDAAVARIEAFRGTLPTSIPGGGGTAFDPGLRAAEGLRPDAIVYFTDGCVSSVSVVPRVPVLWLLTPTGVDPNSAFAVTNLRGRRVRMARHFER